MQIHLLKLFLVSIFESFANQPFVMSPSEPTTELAFLVVGDHKPLMPTAISFVIISAASLTWGLERFVIVLAAVDILTVPAASSFVARAAAFSWKRKRSVCVSAVKLKRWDGPIVRSDCVEGENISPVRVWTASSHIQV